jgi:4-hydroxybenzoate polyprenyltransferase
MQTLLAFFAFCCIASAVYIFNDSKDIAADRIHPVKKNRPLAAGTVTLKEGYTLASILLGIGLAVGYWSNPRVVWVLGIYIGINYLYSVRLKHIALVDVSLIAFGFLLRLLAGSFASDTTLSIWIIIETYLLALFLALAKRRTDFILHLEGISTRKNIDHYNLSFIDTALGVLSALITVAYLMYCLSPEVEAHYQSKYLYVSTFFVLNGLLRYLKLALVDQTPLAPNTLLVKDRYLQINILAWIVFMGSLLYGSL